MESTPLDSTRKRQPLPSSTVAVRIDFGGLSSGLFRGVRSKVFATIEVPAGDLADFRYKLTLVQS